MGYGGKQEERKKAVLLRKQGYSYKEILKMIRVSKSSISLWCRDIQLTEQQIQSMANKRMYGAIKGSIAGAKKQQNDRIIRTKALFNEGIKKVGLLSARDRFISGIGLYAGDGEKGDKAFGFSNANPLIIKRMLQWLREFGGIPENRYRGKVWIHEGLSVMDALDFWSKTTGIDQNQFQKTYISKNKTNSNKVRKNIHKHGIFAIRVADSSLQRKMLGFMAGLLTQ